MSEPLIKEIVVARAGRNFRNGSQEFDLTRYEIDGIIDNFSALGKQVPLILTPEHKFSGQRSNVPAAGWVEAMHRNGDDWVARVKFIGEAADYVRNDQFRGVSIGTVNAHDVHGNPVGEALDHLLLTNSPFFPLNISVSASDLSPDQRVAAADSTVSYVSAIAAQPAPSSAWSDLIDRQAIFMRRLALKVRDLVAPRPPSAMDQAQQAYATALTIGDSELAALATEEKVRLRRAAANIDAVPENLLRAVPDKFRHPGPNPPDVKEANKDLPHFGSYMNPGFDTKLCSKCGEAFETQSARTKCNECLTGSK